MTVKDLIAILNTFDENLRVVSIDLDDYRDLEADRIRVEKHLRWKNNDLVAEIALYI